MRFMLYRLYCILCLVVKFKNAVYVIRDMIGLISPYLDLRHSLIFIRILKLGRHGEMSQKVIE